MKIYVMDAFAARLFGGNQAGVALPEGDAAYIENTLQAACHNIIDLNAG